jgi:hypothetical protein
MANNRRSDGVTAEMLAELEQSAPILAGSAEHFADVAENRRAAVLAPDEPIPETPIL